jgi:hypothetical protein
MIEYNLALKAHLQYGWVVCSDARLCGTAEIFQTGRIRIKQQLRQIGMGDDDEE